MNTIRVVQSILLIWLSGRNCGVFLSFLKMSVRNAATLALKGDYCFLYHTIQSSIASSMYTLVVECLYDAQYNSATSSEMPCFGGIARYRPDHQL